MSEPNPQYQNQQYNQSPFRLFEGMLPTGAKNLVRGTYGVIGVAALALGICLLVWAGHHAQGGRHRAWHLLPHFGRRAHRQLAR